MSEVNHQVKVTFSSEDECENLSTILMSYKNKPFPVFEKLFVDLYSDNGWLELFEENLYELDIKIKKKVVVVSFLTRPSDALEADDLFNMFRAVAPLKLEVKVYDSQTNTVDCLQLDLENYETLKKGVEFDKKFLKRLENRSAFFLLQTVCQLNDYETMEKLFSLGITPNKPLPTPHGEDHFGYTPFCIAASFGDIKMIQLMQKNGGEIIHKVKRNDFCSKINVFHAAAHYSNLENIQYLASLGEELELNEPSDFGDNALDAASGENGDLIYKFIKSIKKTKTKCPFCGESLRTEKAKQCPSCFQSWKT